MTSIIEIKTYSPEYLEAMQRFLDQLTTSPMVLTESMFQELLKSENSHLFFIMKDEQIAGMLTVGIYHSPTGGKAWIEDVVVDETFRGSLNTPNMLNNSLSVVGGLILGDFAVSIGWLIPEVILYMAFVAIANFTQRSYELGYAIKFMRILLLIVTALFGIWGYVAGFLLIITLTATNSTLNGRRNYLYPLIPFNARALRTLLFRVKKDN